MSSVSFFFFFFRLHILGCLRTVVWFAMHDLVVVFSTLGNRHLSSPIYTKTTRLHLNLTPQRRHGSGASTWICFQRQQGVGGRQWSGSVSHGASLRLQPAGETAGVPGQCCRQHEADETVISLLTTGELLHCYRRCEVLRQGLSILRWYLFCINWSVLFHCSLYYPKLDFFSPEKFSLLLLKTDSCNRVTQLWWIPNIGGICTSFCQKAFLPPRVV